MTQYKQYLKNCSANKVRDKINKQIISQLSNRMQPNFREQSPVQLLRAKTPKQSSLSAELRSEIAHSEDQTMGCIWQCFKTASFYQGPYHLRAERNNAVKLMIECHKLMKLPTETIFLSVSILDKILNSNFQLARLSTGESINVNLLAIACLYSCQKLQKIRNYGVSHWLKHLSSETLIGLGYSNVILSGECLKKYEAYILEKTNYNIYTITTFDILMSVWAVRIPGEKEFYFSQFLLELCLFVDFPNLRIEHSHTNTASSVNEQVENQEVEDCDKYSPNKYAIDIVLAIVCLSFHFFKRPERELEQLIKHMWAELGREENEKEFEFKKSSIKQMANAIFMKMLSIDSDSNCQSIKSKFSKQVNMAVFGLKYTPAKNTGNFTLTRQLHSSE